MKNVSGKVVSKRPVIFVSYSHDSENHRAKVMKLVYHLRGKIECDCRIDREADPTSWPRWMRKQIQESDFVLMVFTKIYRRRFDGEEKQGKGLGATWEGSIIENLLYAAASGPAASKFVPVVLNSSDRDTIPCDVFAGTFYQLPEDWGQLTKKLGTTRCNLSKLAKKENPKRNMGNPTEKNLSVFFVGAESGTDLDLHVQFALTRQAVKSAKLGTNVRMHASFDLTPEKMIMEINARSPDVLHLSGKQYLGQLKMHDSKGALVPISADYLARLLVEYDNILKLVILDTCWSLSQARKIVKTIPAAIGVAAAIAEPVAIDFFAMFFNSLASGASVGRAYSLAWGLQMAKISGNVKYKREIEDILETRFNPKLHLPVVVARKGVDLHRLFLVQPS